MGGGIVAVGIVATLVGTGMSFAAIIDEQGNQGEDPECGLLGCHGGPDEGRSWLNADLAQMGWTLGGFGLAAILAGALIAGTGKDITREEQHARQVRHAK
ncbi:MAG: hypothetical protein ACPHID_07700 [Thermoplasmatota archaeon]